MVLPQAMAWVQYWFCVLSLKFCGKSKKICGDISQLSPAFCMYAWVALTPLLSTIVLIGRIDDNDVQIQQWEQRHLLMYRIWHQGLVGGRTQNISFWLLDTIEDEPTWQLCERIIVVYIVAVLRWDLGSMIISWRAQLGPEAVLYQHKGHVFLCPR